MNPLVSVIIPVYNSEEFLEVCLQSLEQQTFKDFEIILVDDASTDKTRELIKKWEERDVRIRFFHNGKKSGQGKARSVGVKKSRSDYLVFIDADDWVNETYLEDLYISISNGDADMAVCDCVEINMNTQAQKRREQSCKEFTLLEVFPTMHCKIWRKDFFLKYKVNPPEFYFEDIATVPFYVAVAKEIVYTPGSVYYYRQYALSTTKTIYSLEDRGKSLQYLVDLFKDNGIFEKNKDSLFKFIQMRSQIDLRVGKEQLKDEYEKIYHQHENIIRNEFHVSFPDPYSNQERENKLYERFVFPWRAIKAGTSIVIYGGGVVGKTFLSQISRNPHCHVLAVCDQNPRRTGIQSVPVIDLTELAGWDISSYDKILIAIEKEQTAFHIRSVLNIAGIPMNKIVWFNPAVIK